MRASQKLDTRVAEQRERIRRAIDAGYLPPPWYFDAEADALSIVPEPREQDLAKLMISM